MKTKKSSRSTAAKTGFSAAFDQKTAMEMEEGASSKARGLQRRVALLHMTQDSASLINFAKSEPKAFEETANLVLDFREHAKALLEVADAAAARVAYVHMEVQHV